MSRKMLWGVLAVGILMIVAPFALGLPGKTAAGEEMLDAFEPLMTQQSVDETVRYYQDVFTPLGEIVPALNQDTVDKFNAYLAGIGAMGTEAQALVPTMAQATGMTDEQVGEFMAGQFPSMMQMLQGLPQMQQDFGDLMGMMGANVEVFQEVPPGLDHYKPLVDTVVAQQDNFHDVASLPDFRLFTWFFVIPGLVLAALALVGLFVGRGAAPEPAVVETA